MISVKGISISFDIDGVRRTVLDDVSLEVGSGEIISLVGSNGSGKTTFLRLVAGLLKPDSGSVVCTADTGEDAIIGLTHQNYREALFPWRTAYRNIHLGLERRAARLQSAAGVDRAIGEIMDRLRIAHLAHQRPGSMSGGQAQLVAIARALAHPGTGVLLLDEPLSALDGRNLRRAAQEVITVSRRNRASTILITHDLDVGIMMGDRIAVLTYEAKGIAKVIDGPAAGRFDTDFLTDESFLQCKKDVLEALYPGGEAK